LGTKSRFDRFLSNIHLTADDRADAKTKYDGVAGKLHSHYYGTPYDGSTKLLIGSYGKHTAVRPPRDVDVLFLMPYADYQRFDGYSGNGQSALLQEIRGVLQERYTTTEKIRGDGQVVVVPFKGGHTVELLPAWTSRGGQYIIPDTHGGGRWKIVDHKAEIKNVSDSDARSNGNTRNLIQMMKVWQYECNVPIKSLALELRAVNFLATWQHYDKGTVYYDWMVRDFLGEFLRYVNGSCKIPGIDEKCFYGDAWQSRAESAYARAKKACEHEAADRDYDAAVEWRKIFGGQYGF
jgi:Second Messenger Oligonucleotide or Dinucleotide Synthetase domain